MHVCKPKRLRERQGVELLSVVVEIECFQLALLPRMDHVTGTQLFRPPDRVVHSSETTLKRSSPTRWVLEEVGKLAETLRPTRWLLEVVGKPAWPRV